MMDNHHRGDVTHGVKYLEGAHAVHGAAAGVADYGDFCDGLAKGLIEWLLVSDAPPRPKLRYDSRLTRGSEHVTVVISDTGPSGRDDVRITSEPRCFTISTPCAKAGGGVWVSAYALRPVREFRRHTGHVGIPVPREKSFNAFL